MKAPGPCVVLLLDTGNEWGGGTNSMIELLKRIDRSRFSFTACLYKDYRKGGGEFLSRTLQALGVQTVLLPPLLQPMWAKLAKEVLRLLFFWSRGLRRRAIWQIEKRWRIDPRASQLAKLARETGAGLLYVNNQPSSNLEGYLAGRLAGLPVIQHCRIDTELLPREVAIVNDTAAAMICVSGGLLESMSRQGIRHELLSCVHNGVDLSGADFRSGRDIEGQDANQNQFCFGTVGNLMPRKSVDHLLRAAARMKALGEAGFRVAIVGDGAERAALEALAAKLGLGAEVAFCGFLEEPLPVVAKMDVFAFCSRKEGFPRVVIEAMALGKPVVSSNVVGPREAVENGETGFLYEYGDIEELASLLIALRRDPALRRRLGTAGRERVQRLFSVEAYVTGVSRILSSVAPRPADGTRR